MNVRALVGGFAAAVLFCALGACAPQDKPGVVTKEAYPLGQSSTFSQSDAWGVVVIGHAAVADDHLFISYWGRVDPADGRYVNFAEAHGPVEVRFVRTARILGKTPYTLPAYQAFRLPPGRYRLMQASMSEAKFTSGMPRQGSTESAKADDGTPLEFDVRAGQVTFFGHVVTERSGRIVRVAADEATARADLRNVPSAVLSTPWTSAR